MNVSRYKTPSAILCVGLTLFSVIWNTQDFVLCITDSHAAIEQAVEGKCTGFGARHADPPAQASLMNGECPSGLDCLSCSDIPLSGKFMGVAPAILSKAFFKTDAVTASILSIASVDPYTACLSSRTRHDSPDQVSRIVATSVIRICSKPLLPRFSFQISTLTGDAYCFTSSPGIRP